MRRLLLILVLFNFIFQGVDAVCTCYQTGNYTGKNAPISNAFDSSDFSACDKTCQYTAYSGDDTFGWTNFTIQWGSLTNSGGYLQIFDGSSTSGTPIISVNEGENVISGDSKNKIQSSQPVIVVKYSGGTSNNTYYGGIKARQGLLTTSAPTSTTPVPSTVTYNTNLFSKDPGSISHDILVVVNQKSNGGLVSLIKMNAIITNFVTKLSTTFDINSSSGSRLSLATLTPYSPYYSMQGGIWEQDATSLVASLPKSGISIEGNIDTALTGLVDLVFTVNKNTSADTRNYAQRSIVLLTGEWPSTGATLGADVQDKFQKMGVNLLVVGFNLTSTETSQLLNPTRWYNAINTIQTNDQLVASFINPFYFNDKSDNNYWCPIPSIVTATDTTGVITASFSEPSDYIGADGSPDKLDWTKLPEYSGQQSRYCNFGNNEYVYNKPPNVDQMLVTVYYELEAGKDILNFYDSSNTLIATFTGFDIAGSSFYTSTSKLTARYTSDNKSVYRGFYVSIKSTPSS